MQFSGSAYTTKLYRLPVIQQCHTNSNAQHVNQDGAFFLLSVTNPGKIWLPGTDCWLLGHQEENLRDITAKTN